VELHCRHLRIIPPPLCDDGVYEAEAGIRRRTERMEELPGRDAEGALGAARHSSAADRRRAQAIRRESESARPEAKAQAINNLRPLASSTHRQVLG
jgi:hypothetical protein